MPLKPAANFNPALFADPVRGDEIALPNIGRETVHHVDAHDVAEAFVKAMDNAANAVGESFHVVSPGALTLLGYAESVASWYGKEAPDPADGTEQREVGTNSAAAPQKQRRKTGTASVAFRIAPRDRNAFAEAGSMPQLWRQIAPARRTRLGDARMRARALQRDSHVSPQAELRLLYTDRTDTGSEPADRLGSLRTRT